MNALYFQHVRDSECSWYYGCTCRDAECFRPWKQRGTEVAWTCLLFLLKFGARKHWPLSCINFEFLTSSEACHSYRFILYKKNSPSCFVLRILGQLLTSFRLPLDQRIISSWILRFSYVFELIPVKFPCSKGDLSFRNALVIFNSMPTMERLYALNVTYQILPLPCTEL
jgi:hypothetical protein